MGAGQEGRVMWVPGDGTCCWGAIVGHPCDEPSVRVVWREDIVDADPLPRSGVVAVPVCGFHGDTGREWTVIEDHQGWVELQERNARRVWLVEALSRVR
jgi:hypothetical protein